MAFGSAIGEATSEHCQSTNLYYF